MKDEEKAEEYVIKRYGIDKCYREKNEETKKYMKIDVHNDYEEEYQCHLDGLAEGRKEEDEKLFNNWCKGETPEPQECPFLHKLEKENAELKKILDAPMTKGRKTTRRDYAQTIWNISVEKENLEKENAELKSQIERISVTNFNVIEKLKSQIEKMKNIIYEEVDFCSYCPYKDCKNDEGACPYEYLSEEEQKKILAEWIIKNGS